jgi:saccharopine dehydrogenase (NAD+, L-lysine forming)
VNENPSKDVFLKKSKLLSMKIGIIREGKLPPDKRVPFTPGQCRYINENMPGLEIVVQPSGIRCFSDEQYRQHGIRVIEDLSECDVLMGVKEVPEVDLIPGKIYFFFSHTIKKQPYNRNLLRAILKKNIQLIDYETLTDKNGMRIIGFGRFAGLVGAYNGLRAYGLRNGFFNVKPAWLCLDIDEMYRELEGIDLPAIKIALTGGGRVAGGAIELLSHMGIQQLSVDDYLHEEAAVRPVFVQLNPGDYNRHHGGLPFDLIHFYNHPTEYAGNFGRFLPKTDLLIAAAYWDPSAPVLFTIQDTRSPDFRISVIADITCDIDGSVPTTLKASTIDEPFYDFDPISGEILPPFSGEGNITVMAVDNLPCELPADASLDFGKTLIDKVLPCMMGCSSGDIIGRASITKDGTLTERFRYLQDYVDGSD